MLRKRLEQEIPSLVTEKEYQGIAKNPRRARNVQQYMTGGLEVMQGFLGNDVELIGRGLEKDTIVTAVRATLIKGFQDVKKAAKEAGAAAFCISGSGPAVFALAKTQQHAEKIGNAMIQAFNKNNVQAKKYVSRINEEGAKVLFSE